MHGSLKQTSAALRERMDLHFVKKYISENLILIQYPIISLEDEYFN